MPPIKNYIDCEDSFFKDSHIQVPGERGQYLKDEFNAFWNTFWDTEADYYSPFSLEKLIQLKMAVTNINNLITFESTLMAGNRICDILRLSETARTEIMSSIKSTSANSNGFDIEHRGKVPFICEVKANIPSGGKDIFGAQQLNQLVKDVNSLLYGKTKSSIKPSELSCYYKFICMYCNSEKTWKAIQRFIAFFNNKYGNKIEFLGNQNALSNDRIYVLCVPVDEFV